MLMKCGVMLSFYLAVFFPYNEAMFVVYILRTSANTLYVGQTNNLDKRLKEHAAHRGRGSKYVRSFDSFRLVYTESYATRSDAMKRERELKQWSKPKKERLICRFTTESLPGTDDKCGTKHKSRT